MANEEIIKSYNNAALAYERKFKEAVPIMFLRGMEIEERIKAIQERVDDNKDFATYYHDQGWQS